MDTGWQARLEILKRDVQNKILTPLQTHGWTSEILQTVQDGEYLVIEAKRGENTHKIAYLYTTATKNDIYKRLDKVVEHIFANGLYKIESYAFGITVPVSNASDFHDLLIKWNEKSCDGPYAPSLNSTNNTANEANENKSQRIQSENPIKSVWIHLRQLESVTLAKRNIKNRCIENKIELTEKEITDKGEGLAFALRNASDYYRSAEGQNMSQRILNLYYGTLAFATGEMLSSPTGPKTLVQVEDSTKQGHGLFTLDGNTDSLDDLIIGVIKSGFFSSYISFLGHSLDSIPAKKPRKKEELKAEDIYWITFQDLLSRVPDIGDLFINVFDSKPGWVIPSADTAANSKKNTQQKTYVKLYDKSGRWTKEDVLKLKFPMTQISELDSENSGKVFRAYVDHTGFESFWSVLTGHRSPYTNHSLIVPIFGTVSNYRAISLSILYALSIVVRYRPSLWRRIQEGDFDYLRVLIEAYLESIERVLPEHYLEKITGKRIVTAQPGSFF